MADGATLTDDALRAEVRAWLAANWTPLPKPPPGPGGAGWTTTPEHKAWLAKVVDARWAANEARLALRRPLTAIQMRHCAALPPGSAFLPSLSF